MRSRYVVVGALLASTVAVAGYTATSASGSTPQRHAPRGHSTHAKAVPALRPLVASSLAKSKAAPAVRPIVASSLAKGTATKMAVKPAVRPGVASNGKG